MMTGIVRLAIFFLVAAGLLGPFAIGALLAGGEMSRMIETGLAAGAIGALVASGGWVERLTKRWQRHEPE